MSVVSGSAGADTVFFVFPQTIYPFIRPAVCGHGRCLVLLPAAGLYLSARLLRFSFRPFIRVNQAAGDVKKPWISLGG